MMKIMRWFKKMIVDRQIRLLEDKAHDLALLAAWRDDSHEIADRLLESAYRGEGGAHTSEWIPIPYKSTLNLLHVRAIKSNVREALSYKMQFEPTVRRFIFQIRPVGDEEEVELQLVLLRA